MAASEHKQPVLPPGNGWQSLAFRRVDWLDAMAVWRRNLLVHLRTWKVQVVAPVIEPIFSVLAFGWGVGALISSRVDNVPYLTFVGAGVLAFTVIMRAMFETTYASYFRMVYQSTYDAILATPVDAESLAGPEVLAVDRVVEDVLPPLQAPFLGVVEVAGGARAAHRERNRSRLRNLAARIFSSMARHSSPS